MKLHAEAVPHFYTREIVKQLADEAYKSFIWNLSKRLNNFLHKASHVTHIWVRDEKLWEKWWCPELANSPH